MYQLFLVFSVILTSFITAREGFEVRFDSGYITWYDDKEGVHFECYDGHDFLEAHRVFSYTKNVKNVAVVNCFVPPRSYYDLFTLVNINVSELNSLELKMKPQSPLTKAHFAKLPISTLGLIYDYNQDPIHELPEDLFEYLKLSVLVLDSVVIPKLIESRYDNDYKGVEKLILSDRALIKSFNSCDNLRELVLAQHKLHIIVKGWLTNCSNLESVAMIQYETAIHMPLLLDVLHGVKSLRSLTIWDQYIDAFTDGQNEEKYSNNAKVISTVQDLDLLNSEVTNRALLYLLHHTPLLQSLNLSHVYEEVSLDTRGQENGHSTLKLDYLEYINIDMSTIITFRMDNVQANSLKVISLRYTDVGVLYIKGLPYSSNQYFVDLWHSKLSDIVLDQEDYIHLREGEKNISFLIDMDRMPPNYVSCDCEHGWLARALRENQVTFPNVKCKDGSDIVQVRPERIECDKYACAGGCVCRRAWSSNAVDVNCDETAYGSYNTGGGEKTVRRPSKTIVLGINPVACNCETMSQIEDYYSNKYKIYNFDGVICEDGRFLKDVPLSEMCPEKVNLPTLIITTLSVIFGVINFGMIMFLLYHSVLCISILVQTSNTSLPVWLWLECLLLKERKEESE